MNVSFDINQGKDDEVLLDSSIFPSLSTAGDGTHNGPQQIGSASVWNVDSSSAVVAAIRAAPRMEEDTTNIEPKNSDDSPTLLASGLDILQPIRRRAGKGRFSVGPTTGGDAHSTTVSKSGGTESIQDQVRSHSFGAIVDLCLDNPTLVEVTSLEEVALPRDGDSENAFEVPPGSVLQRRGNVNISKLRDRWWNAVQEHDRKMRQQMLEQQQQIQQQQQQQREEEGYLEQAQEILDQGEPLRLRSDKTKGLETERQSIHLPSSAIADLPDDRCLSIHEIIRHDDVKALERLLRTLAVKPLHPETSDCSRSMSPLQLAVHLNRTQMVRAIGRVLERKSSDSSYLDCAGAENDYLPPLLIAAESGYEECLQILLSAFGSASLLSSRDSQGNTAFHCCCRSGEVGTLSGTSTFSLLLNCAISSSAVSRSSASFLYRVLSSRNKQEQTPLHVACQYERADIVDCILTHRSTANSSLLAKIFDLQDVEGQTPLLAAISSGATDVVMSLLMWRGNNRGSKKGPPCLQQETIRYGSGAGLISTATPTVGTCPLVWAVRSNNVEMVSLLLEFNDPLLGSGYNLNDALYYAVSNKNLNDVDIIHVLVEAGANPCAIREENSRRTSLPACLRHSASICRTAVALAAFQHDQARLAALLDAHREYLERIRCSRRRDPKLQKQPESFFVNMDATEDAERREAMRDALVISLFNILSSDVDRSSLFVVCALALYRRGVHPIEADIDRLKQSFSDNKLSPLAGLNAAPLAPHPCTQYESVYLRRVPPYKKESEKHRALHYYSRQMLELTWFDLSASRIQCAWLSHAKNDRRHRVGDFMDPDIVLVCSDGAKFCAHKDVVTRASDKIAAAIRFATMSRDANGDSVDANGGPFELKIDMTSKICRWMLEHMYHGSIACGLSKKIEECCVELLELLLVAEEYICKSLVQECEMRLLSSVETYDLCFCSYCSANAGNKVAIEGKPDAVECTLQVSGPSMIDTNLALDVLAISQHVSGSSSESDYTIRVTKSGRNQLHLCSPLSQSGCIVHGPLKALREVAVRMIISKFDELPSDEIDVHNGQEMLLRMCLDDLRSFCCPTGTRSPGCLGDIPNGAQAAGESIIHFLK